MLIPGKAALTALSLPRALKRLIVLMVDAALCVLTLWASLCLRLGEWVVFSGLHLNAAVVSIAFALPLFVAFGLYRAIFRYAAWPALLAIAKASSVYALLFGSVVIALGLPEIPRTVGVIQPGLLMFTVGASRVLARFWLGGLYRQRLKLATLPRALIYGAGSAGRQLAAALANSHEVRVVGFLDDDARLHRRILNGLPIYSPLDLEGLVDSLNISDILLALPTAGHKRRNEILASISHVHVSVRTLPSVTELVQGRVSVADLRDLDLNDLLGREPVVPNVDLLTKNVAGKRVLVTGAGGSIGAELCRQIVKIGPSCLLLVEQSEFALYEIHQELIARLGGVADHLIPLLASVQDEARMRLILGSWRPQTIYHAAAYKHVPLVEHNPLEGVRNNVFGTKVVAELAREYEVEDFVLISTDKAVRPSNIMGASKRLAEMILQAISENTIKTRFSMVRFGNVLGSSGSVVPLFRQQIRQGGPLTLTHPEITRYFMTIPEAAQLVIQAGAMAQGGDVFVLDMGEPVRIYDLARRMVELSGLSLRDRSNPDGDIEIEITGLRPGEKLFEELLIGDNPERSSHPNIMKAHEKFVSLATLTVYLDNLRSSIAQGDVPGVRRLLREVVIDYSPQGGIVDWVYRQQMSSQ